MSLSRSIINALLPEGAFWEPAAGNEYDLLLDGMAENTQQVYEFLKQLQYLRDPQRTPILSDVEKEYAIFPSALATEQQRRDRLTAFMFRRANTGAYDVLQAKLREAGFTDVYVHENSPAVDPDIFLAQDFNMTCGDVLPSGNLAQCGEPEAICASVGGELLVNGDLYENRPKYSAGCGMMNQFNPEAPFVPPMCGADEPVYCGDFDGYKTTGVDEVYEVPEESGYWPLFFFVGGEATRDEYGFIAEIKSYSVPSERRLEFRRVILKFKPLHAWGVLITVYD